MKLKLIIVISLLLLYIQFFSFREFDDVLYGRLSRIVALFLTAILLILTAYKTKNFIDKIVIGLMIIPWLSLISALTLHNQDYADTASVTCINFVYSLYFLLIYFKSIDAIKIVIMFGFIWCILNVLQQYTYPNFLFGKQISSRNDFLNFHVFGSEFGILFIFYEFSMFINARKIWKPLMFFLLGLYAIYLMSTRQVLVCVAISCIFGLFQSKRIKFYQFTIVTVFIIVLYFNFSTLFGHLIEVSNKEDWSYQARSMSWLFYGITYNKGNLLAILLGNGDANITTSYGQEIDRFQSLYGNNIGLWRDDVGIIGTYSIYGLFYIALVLYFFLKVIKEYKNFDLYLKMLTLYMLLELPAIFYFCGSIQSIACHSVILYVFRESYIRNKKLNKR